MTATAEQVLTCSVKPLHDRVVILPEESEGVTAGGIIIPDAAQKRAEAGHVLAVGPGEFNAEIAQRIPLTVQVGDRVAFGRYAGTEMEIDGETCFVMREAEIFGILDDAAKINT